MPTLQRLPASRVLMVADDHLLPHVHVKRNDGCECTVDIDTREIKGRIAAREIRDELAWIAAKTISTVQDLTRSSTGLFDGSGTRVYLRDSKLERKVRRSQNRIESFHQLRGAIAQVGGKKDLTGRTDIEIEISNQCARLIANAVIYYNSTILSRLLAKYEAIGNAKALALITQISPAAWRHILLNGNYTFQSDGKMIDLDALVPGLDLG
jgi:hypothetical protein